VPGVRCLGRRRFAGRRQTLTFRQAQGDPEHRRRVTAFAASARQATTSLAVTVRWTRSFPRTGGALQRLSDFTRSQAAR